MRTALSLPLEPPRDIVKDVSINVLWVWGEKFDRDKSCIADRSGLPYEASRTVAKVP